MKTRQGEMFKKEERKIEGTNFSESSKERESNMAPGRVGDEILYIEDTSLGFQEARLKDCESVL